MKGIAKETRSGEKCSREHAKGLYERFVKRPQDLVLSVLALVLVSPVLLVIAILVRVKLGYPVIFTQERPGKNERIFHLYKFRSMTDERDENGELLPDSERLSSFGKMLRASSLDELPELINVIKGDMSIVGPRPLLVRYLSRYSEYQARRHEVRPGLTGLAQVHGRNAITWEEKLEWDVKYTENITFVGDWGILFKTVKIVLQKKGIHSDTSATMDEFYGSSQNKEVDYDRKI